MRRKSELLLGMILTLLAFSVSAKDYTAEECPVVGNTETKIYHVQGGLKYRQMLQENKANKDNRRCFGTEGEARKAGYRKSKS